MKIFKSIEELNNIEPNVCALGNFDGIHKGHQTLIKNAVEQAKTKGLKSAVFTFTDHPINVMSGSNRIKMLLKFEDKAKIIEALDVDYMFTFDFIDAIRTLSPEDYARHLLVEKLNIKHVVCGFNYNFGYKASGNTLDLKRYGSEMDFGVTVIDPVIVDNVTVSSTIIRGAIESGDVESYKRYTGRNYELYGTIIEGEHNGRKMGFPTVNLSLDTRMALPANGVYTTVSLIDGRALPSVTNVGNKPTIGTFAKNAETHIFNFNETAYGRPLKVEFIKMQRPEHKFASMEELAKQIDMDCINAKKNHGI